MSNDAKDTPANVPAKSGCGCSSKRAAAETGKNAAGCCGGGGDHDHAHDEHLVVAKAVAHDPVCGMTVDPATSKHRSDYGGETYHFCSEGAEPSSPPIPRNI